MYLTYKNISARHPASLMPTERLFLVTATHSPNEEVVYIFYVPAGVCISPAPAMGADPPCPPALLAKLSVMPRGRERLPQATLHGGTVAPRTSRCRFPEPQPPHPPPHSPRPLPHHSRLTRAVCLPLTPHHGALRLPVALPFLLNTICLRG